MASCLEVNDPIYNTKRNAYKDFKKKLEFKAAGMDTDLDILKTWYRFIRSRCTSLVHREPRSHCGNEKTLRL